jgi:polyhydroxyalkanoate synthesis regulator phasin
MSTARSSRKTADADDQLADHAPALVETQADDDQHRWFNQPDADADFEYWSKCDALTIDEATALCFGKDPAVVYYGEPSAAHEHSNHALCGLTTVSPFAAAYERMRELIQSSVTAGKLSSPMSPADLVSWTEQKKVPLDRAFKAQIEVLYGELPTQETVQKLRSRVAELEAKLKKVADNPNARKVQTLQMIAYALAKKHTRFDPKARSSAVTNIKNFLELDGLSLDDETARNCLREAFDAVEKIKLERDQ